MNVKISISQEASLALDEMLALAMDGFTEGRITRQDLVSWIILAYRKRGIGQAIPKIRETHRDPILVLQAQIAELRAKRKSRNPLASQDENSE